jgi:signal transduction histidine kinase
VAESTSAQAFLSTKAASPVQRRVALATVSLLLVAFIATAPYAAIPLHRSDAFIPAYESALIIDNAITAALLYAQFAILRTRSLLILATGYFFTALIVFPHMLTFPGLFTPTGLLGAGPSSTAWLYVLWHVGFPLAVLAYALHDRDPVSDEIPESHARGTIMWWALATVVVVIAIGVLTTAGEPWLPRVMASGITRSSRFPYISAAVWLFTAVTLVMLWWRRRRSVLDLWLSVVLCAWLCEIPLSVMLAPSRFSVGFYFGRVYSLVASCIVLVMMLSETTTLYARLARAIATERRERERRLAEMEAVLVHLARVNDLGQVVTTLIHEVNQPLAALGNYLSALQRLAAMGNTDKILPTIEKTIGQSERARDIIRRLREFADRRETNLRTEVLAETIEDAVAVAQVASGRGGVEIGITLDPLATHVVMDRIQIEQVLVNLIRNAIEAMAQSERRRLTVTSHLTDDEKVEISIADTGPGLPADIRERLFDPFVTTKSSGMGVGLWICRFIVEAHGEKLQAADNPGGGTVFRFTLTGAAGASDNTIRSASEPA